MKLAEIIINDVIESMSFMQQDLPQDIADLVKAHAGTVNFFDPDEKKWVLEFPGPEVAKRFYAEVDPLIKDGAFRNIRGVYVDIAMYG